MRAHPSILIIAGEISGDMHAAGLVRAIRAKTPDTAFFGIGGPEMRAAGVDTLYDIKDMAVMGFVEVLRRFFFFRRVFHNMLAVARDRKPNAVLLVDYPGFNLRFAAKIHGTGPRVIYYICPQVWAWHRSRIPGMARILDRLITIFPFEATHFEGTGLHVDFAGHPLVDEARRAMDVIPPELPWKGDPRIALLPGSRIQVIENVLPTMWAAARQLEDSHPNCSFILPAPSPKIEQVLREHLGRLPAGPARWEIVTGNTRQVLRQASAAMVASGTATIETSLMLCPMIVVYRMPALNFFLARRLVSVENIGMVNILAGKKICPEFIQDQATPDALAKGIRPLLDETPERATMLKDLRRANATLGPGGAAARAADAVLAAMKRP